MPTRPKYYWESSTFLAWITDEPTRTAEEKAGLTEIVAEIDAGKAILVTSAITSGEVLEANLTDEQKKRYDLVLKRPMTVKHNVDIRVSELAGKIRDHYNRLPPDQRRKIRLPDAIHLATAILLQVDELHSLDPHMLSLNGNVAGHNLRICKPAGKQTLLPNILTP